MIQVSPSAIKSCIARMMCPIVMGSSLLAGGCGVERPDLARLQFDAAHSIALDGVISNGRILTTATDDEQIKDQINDQLYYSIGILNGYNGVADLNRTPRELITINERNPLDAGLIEIRYSAKLFVAWPRERAIPASIALAVPADTENGIFSFFEIYNVPACVDSSAHDVSAGIFWYYYRPNRSQCPLADPTRDDPKLVSRFNLILGESSENTAGKYPEYSKVWEDGRLTVTAVFGKETSGATSLNDPGIAAYNAFYKQLLRDFGRPVYMSERVPSRGPGVEITDVRLRFRVRSGEVDAHLFLVESIQSVGADFNAKYNAQTAKSDFVSYSGHSGLGANIRALARKGSFEPGQYRIYMVNGCDTFAYVDDMLRDKSAQSNPDFGPNKFFDIITNAMPSYFHMNSHSNMVVIHALLGKRLTFRQMLANFDGNQRPVVTGEHDNSWPAPF